MSGRCLGLSVWLSCLLAVVPLRGFAADNCQHLTATGNPEYPPYLWRDPHNPAQLIGANADLLKQVAKDLGLVVDVMYVGPWSRAQEEVSSGRIDMLAGYFRTQARELLTDFISPPFLFNSSVVWVRKGEGFAYSDWSDLKGRRGGTLVNNSHGQAFDDYARAQLDLEAVPSVTQAFQKLLLKRSDYVIFEQYPGMALARALGKEKELEVLEPPVSSEGLYLALSHKSGCNQPALREALARKMRELVAGPLPEKLVAENLERWQRQQAGK
ncbi:MULTISPECIES: ABC transporter substrate-binding protein [unclassified Pseudomonas]|uniref:substrate-binding periplasmic protein n=1 Tax=unclassified Pseudomonas TaxID=196821 RepID=UPI000C88AA87|nr:MULTISPECIES: transporter substrate-binding domain-containing protein [unclassified Pseudomonas]PMZ94926.1 amino acid ABC transporter substrate-binding protein [Pseudomonas sp. FW305-42]PNA23825.1 amino acid ABC transporter substrate-binding protein [Pseudomonas sp. MPR-R1B]PNB24620.1 amino acid ABC transporter substrate-binding protein [Pseudomonas sp. DP16D-E2]PNB42082.1 amino acid ABC transporter substrate-binding protein [Pseudomonas sp. FW305-17]PNB58498.1 amino acid ABC transporter su